MYQLTWTEGDVSSTAGTIERMTAYQQTDTPSDTDIPEKTKKIENSFVQADVQENYTDKVSMTNDTLKGVCTSTVHNKNTLAKFSV